MASILRQIVAGPRLQHPEAGLDLCYVTDNIIATSGPSSNYPQRAYRTPLDELVTFLDSKHGENWCIWEFRAEGTGYPDEEVYGRIHHYPWPDHHPPPFALIPAMMGSMKNWIHRLDGSGNDDVTQEDNDKDTDTDTDKGKKNRVVVVHCKAGKGRSGTVACSYLISQEGWKMEDALQRFTERRMRAGFGPGVSIQSQVRWVGYVNRWTNEMTKKYVERPVEILEIHVWGLRDGVKVAVEGYVDEGKKIKCFHLFHRSERTVVEAQKTIPTENSDESKESLSATNSSTATTPSASSTVTPTDSGSPARNTTGVLFRPKKPIIVPTSDINIDFERRSKAAYTGWAMVTSIAHIWFNTYFEGGNKQDSGVFEAEWDDLDGIKGTTKKGVRALDRLQVVWRYPHPSQLGIKASATEEAVPVPGDRIAEPKPGESIHESHAADWRGRRANDVEETLERDRENIPIRVSEAENNQKTTSAQSDHSALTNISARASGAAYAATHSVKELGKELGLRKQTDESKDVSLAESDDNSSVVGRKRRHAAKDEPAQEKPADRRENGDFEGVRPYFGDKDRPQDGSDVQSESKASPQK